MLPSSYADEKDLTKFVWFRTRKVRASGGCASTDNLSMCDPKNSAGEDAVFKPDQRPIRSAEFRSADGNWYCPGFQLGGIVSGPVVSGMRCRRTNSHNSISRSLRIFPSAIGRVFLDRLANRR